MSNTFEQINLQSELIAGLKKQGINSPTEIQINTINHILENKDIIAESYTGSGKTLAYLLPIFERIDTSKRENQALILAPTHELVMQIESQIQLLAQNSGLTVTSLPIIGEVNIQKQIKKLKDTKPHIIVGSSGRVLDLIKQRKIKAHTLKTIVLDETDSLLSGNNVSVIKDIVKTTLRDRQILAFSASMSEKSLDILSNLMKEHVVIKAKRDTDLNPNISHMYLLGERRDKFTLLRKSLAATNAKKAIIFVNDEDSIDIITDKLNYHNRPTLGISGNMTKEQREKAMKSFRSGKIRTLVSSDLSARGLDINDITHVFNLDFPASSNEYIHRCGRTARGTNKGTAISIITPRELAPVRVYEREFNIKIQPKELSEGNLVPMKNSKQNNNKI